MPMHVEVETTPVEIQTKLKRIANEYADAPNYRKRMLLDHVLAVPEAGICDPVRVQTRGRPTGSIRRDFYHNLSMWLLLWMIQCISEDVGQATEHNARACHQPGSEPAAVGFASQVVLPSTVDLEVQNLWNP